MRANWTSLIEFLLMSLLSFHLDDKFFCSSKKFATLILRLSCRIFMTFTWSKPLRSSRSARMGVADTLGPLDVMSLIAVFCRFCAFLYYHSGPRSIVKNAIYTFDAKFWNSNIYPMEIRRLISIVIGIV